MQAIRIQLRGKSLLIAHSHSRQVINSRYNPKYPIRTSSLSRSMASATSTGKNNQLKYLLVLDFEATCGDVVRENEIIEFPTLVYNLQEDKVQATFHEYVRPTITPTLTKFCTDLTGITQVSHRLAFYVWWSWTNHDHSIGCGRCRRYLSGCLESFPRVPEIEWVHGGF